MGVLSNRSERLLVSRYVLAILSIQKVLTVPVAPSLKSITDIYTGLEDPGSDIDFEKAFNNLGVSKEVARGVLEHSAGKKEFHQSMAAGPNGHSL